MKPSVARIGRAGRSACSSCCSPACRSSTRIRRSISATSRASSFDNAVLVASRAERHGRGPASATTDVLGARVRHDRRARRSAARGRVGRGFPGLGDDPLLPGSRHRPRRPFLLRLGAVRHARSSGCVAAPRSTAICAATSFRARRPPRPAARHRRPPALRTFPPRPRLQRRCRSSTYGGVLFVLFPLIILTGLAMSPGDERGLALACWTSSAAGRRRAPSISSSMVLLVALLRRPHRS